MTAAAKRSPKAKPAAAAIKLAAPRPRDVVHQAELRELLEAHERQKKLCIGIRARLESGANFEHGVDRGEKRGHFGG